ALDRLGFHRLRLGVRRPVAPAAAGGPHAPEVAEVDVGRPDLLAAFCAGCRVVVNCAGPAYQTGPRLAAAARAAGSCYVDPGGDDALRRRLDATRTLAPAV